MADSTGIVDIGLVLIFAMKRFVNDELRLGEQSSVYIKYRVPF